MPLPVARRLEKLFTCAHQRLQSYDKGHVPGTTIVCRIHIILASSDKVANVCGGHQYVVVPGLNTSATHGCSGTRLCVRTVSLTKKLGQYLRKHP